MAFLATQNIVAGQTIVIGNSIGSGIATQIALEFQPAALILISPFSALNILVGEKLPYLPARLLVRDPFDNLSILPDVRAPILLLHGTLDVLISPVHSERLAAAQINAALQLVSGAGHELAYTPAAQSLAMRWLAQTRLGPSQNQ